MAVHHYRPRARSLALDRPLETLRDELDERGEILPRLEELELGAVKLRELLELRLGAEKLRDVLELRLGCDTRELLVSRLGAV